MPRTTSSTPRCLTCRKVDYAERLKEHLLSFRSLFAERGAKVMMWHDMLLVSGDPRWKGYGGTGWNAMSAFNQHLRQVGWDMPVTRYRDTGVAQSQVPPENALLQ